MMMLSVAYKESKGVPDTEMGYENTSDLERVRKKFRVLKDYTDEEIQALQAEGGEAFFNVVYDSNKRKGSLGNTEEGDGAKYAGRGLIQVTGRGNYAKASQDLFGDDRLVENPDLLLNPDTAGQVAAWWVAEHAAGGLQDFDVTKDIPEDKTQDFLNAIYGTVSSGGTVTTAAQRAELQNTESYGEGMPRMLVFLNNEAPNTVGHVIETLDDVWRGRMSNNPPPEAETARRERETARVEAQRVDAETQSTLAFLREQSNSPIPETAQMTADGMHRGYLGGTYGADATGTTMNVVTPEQAAAEAQSLKLSQEFNSLSKEEQSKINVEATMSGLSPDFSYDEVANWGEETYGISEGRANSRNESGIDNTIIGANIYTEDKGHLVYKDGIPERFGGKGISVDETRVLLQSLLNSGLSKEQAFTALADPTTYKALKNTIPKTSYFGHRSLERLGKSAKAAEDWASSTKNRESLAGIPGVQGTSESDPDFWAVKLAPGVDTDYSQRDLRVDSARERHSDKMDERYGKHSIWSSIGKLFGSKETLRARHYPGGMGAQARRASQALDLGVDPNTHRVEPNYGSSGEGFIPDSADREAPRPLQFMDKKGAPQNPKLTPATLQMTPEQRAIVDAKAAGTKTAKVENTDAGGPEQVALNLPGINALQGIPAMASLGSAAIQRRALNQMQAPNAPITTDIPAFNYESDIAQSLEDVRDSTNALSRNTQLPASQRAAMRQGLLGERFRQEQRLRAMDNKSRQAAKTQYDAMSYQVRAAQDGLRNQYLNDSTAFNNQKAMLDAQIKQQPLDVLSASTQDYLKNIYAPNLAALMEAQGRQYNTALDPE
jgi:hypothetical protein